MCSIHVDIWPSCCSPSSPSSSSGSSRSVGPPLTPDVSRHLRARRRRRGRSSLPPPHVKLDPERRRPATVGGGAGGAGSVGFGPAGSSAQLRHPSFVPRFNAARSNANFLHHIQEQRRLKARQAEERFAKVQAMRGRLKERVLRHSKKVTEARQAAVAEEMTLEAAKERAGGGRGPAPPPRGGGGGLWTATRQGARRAKAQGGPREAWPGHGRGDWPV